MYPTDPAKRKSLINKGDEYGRSAIFYSCYHGNYEVMSLLLAAGADACIADSKWKTPLHYVAKNDDSRMVDLIFLHNKDTTRVRVFNTGSKAVDLAKLAKENASEDEHEVWGLNDEQIEDEDDQELNFNKENNERIGSVIEQMSEYHIIKGDEDEKEQLDEADHLYLLNFQDKVGRTALHYAWYHGSVGVVEDLVFLKSNPWIEDIYGNRPIDLIQEGPKYDVLIELLTNNMKISKNPNKKLNLKSLVKENISTLANKGKKKTLKSLEIKDLKLVPDHKLESERLGITIDNYLGFALASK